MSGYDYESTDEESAAHLAADYAEPDDDRPTLADELFGSGERDDAWVEETYRRQPEEISEEVLDDDTAVVSRVFKGREEEVFTGPCPLCGETIHDREDEHAAWCLTQVPEDVDPEDFDA